MILAALLVAGALTTAAPQTSTPPDAAPTGPRVSIEDLPVSIERIRAALDRPAPLTLRRITPDFVVDVRERERFDKLIPPLDFKSGPVPPGGLYAYEQLQRSGVPIAQPLFLIDLIAIGHDLARAHAAHAGAAARANVQRAIAEYCEARPNGGAGIAICAR